MHDDEKGLNWNSPSYFEQSQVYDIFSEKEDALDLVWDALKYRLTGKILDAGCGTGKYLKKCKEHGFDVLGIDRSCEQVSMVNQKDLIAKVCDILDLNSLGLKFDTIFSCWVLGTIPETNRLVALEQMKSCLNPKGIIYLVENKPFSDFELVRGHTEKINTSTLYEQWLRQQGFKEEKVFFSKFGFDSDEQATEIFKKIWGSRITKNIPRDLSHTITLWSLII